MVEDTPIILDPKPVRIDATSGFEFTLPDGKRDRVSSHLSKQAALIWLCNGGGAAWALKRGYVCEKCLKSKPGQT